MVKASADAIVWFRDDLRIADHPALAAASAAGALLCVYISDEATRGLRPLGGAAKWWLHHSLASLSDQLEGIGARLDLLAGPSHELIMALATAAGVSAVHWTRRYGRREREIDCDLAASLASLGVEAREHEGSLLHDPTRTRPKTSAFYKVYTPFLKALHAESGRFAPVLPAPRSVSAAAWPPKAPGRATLSDLQLLPKLPDWAVGLRRSWTPGAPAAQKQLSKFLAGPIARYAQERDAPAAEAVSRLSPRLRFGELSPKQIWRAAEHARERRDLRSVDVAKFLSELAWREFSYHLLFHAPDLAKKNFNPDFDSFSWRDPGQEEVSAWRRGRTGYPLVDAGMRELRQTGYMHNRVRLVVASFLVKDLLIDWRIGEEWFWDTLCDADAANNPANWQWSAGAGADAAPYFRIFNPILQSRKFDPSGEYIRRWVPEVRPLPDRWIHQPSACPADVAAAAGFVIGQTYPLPLVDHGKARERALAEFRASRRST